VGQPFNDEYLPADEAFYANCAMNFGWTPAQVDELPLGFANIMFPLMQILREDAERRASKTKAS
jgi:hypothetical protein